MNEGERSRDEKRVKPTLPWKRPHCAEIIFNRSSDTQRHSCESICVHAHKHIHSNIPTHTHTQALLVQYKLESLGLQTMNECEKVKKITCTNKMSNPFRFYSMTLLTEAKFNII